MLAEYFNSVSAEFSPLTEGDVPGGRLTPLPKLLLHQVAARIRRFRKPCSMVRGDVFPKLVTKYSDFFAIPLCSIYNKITTSKVWPTAWKIEHVTVIPKTSCPANFSGLRNISCTLLASKMYESFVLEWLSSQIRLKDNQFGGVKGCSTAHMLVQLYQDICENLEDYRAATLLTAIDYSKAFSRMSYQHCLNSLAKLGASAGVMQIIASFLTDRVMTVRVGKHWSVPREVTGGCPQGSILGVILFNATINDLEDKIDRQAGPAASPETFVPGGPNFSTPSGPARRDPGPDLSPVGSPVDNGPGARPCQSPFVFLPELHEARRRLEFHSSDDEEVPLEPHPPTQAKWKKTAVSLYKYVDDNISADKINMETAEKGVHEQKAYRDKHAVQTQNLFRTVIRAAEFKGMKINAEKTKIMVVSDAISYTPRAHFYDSDGDRLQNKAGDDSFKCLGFHISSKPSMWTHVEAMRRRFRQRYWVLRHLKALGFTQEQLIKVYKTVILPIADYCCVVYHSQLTDEQDEVIERLQSHALKCVFGPGLSASAMRRLADLTTLRERRIAHVDKFAEKAAASERFGHWFPTRSGRATRGGDQYLESYARCDRLYYSPVFYMRRRLNGKPGKEYGVRNRRYREDR